jgi:predicted nucleotidyltransferase
MKDFSTDFERILAELTEHDVAFIVIGGAAAIALGSVRLTKDLDVVYQRSAANLDRLVAALCPFKPYLRGAPPGLPFRWDRETLKRGLNFTLVIEIGDIDLLGEMTGGGTYEDLLPGSVELELFGFRCRCLSLRQLIHAKRAAGRPRDLDALAELEAIEEESRG